MPGTSHYTEGCKAACLSSRVPLRAGEAHCPACSGCGYQPIPFKPNYTQTDPSRCDWCNGTGKKEP